MSDARALERVKKARAAADAARDRFEQEIRDASAAGVGMRKIGDAAGLSHQRIHQIVNGRATG
jgi:hypothetical protein